MLDKIFGTVIDKSLVDMALTHPSYTKELNLDDLMNYEGVDALYIALPHVYHAKYSIEAIK